jgi:phage anti-repressor protein
MTNQLISVFAGEIQGQSVQFVDARELHQFLESKQDFSDWIKNRIKNFGFIEGQDYLLHKFMEEEKQQLNTFTRVGDRIDYHLALDMAKELGMIERNPKGRQIRQYFIEMERIALGHAPKTLPNPDQPTAEQLLPLQNAILRLVQLTKQGGGKLTEADANGLICHSFGVDTIRQLKLHQLPEATDKAAKIIGLFMMQQDVLEDLTAETLSTKDEDNIKRAISSISQSQYQRNSWMQGSWYAIRKATGRKSPQKLRVKDLPIIAQELERILVIAIRFKEFQYETEANVIRETLRDAVCIEPFLAQASEDNRKRMATLATQIRSQIREWETRGITALRDRKEEGHGDYSAYDEPNPI